MMFKTSLVSIAAALAVCSYSKPMKGVAPGQAIRRPAAGDHSRKGYTCPSAAEIEAELGRASESLTQGQYRVAAETLKSPSILDCDPRASLLLAAALDAEGNVPGAEQALQESHAIWPSNNSIAASLAREYLNSGQTGKALQALTYFHATHSTRLQEMQMAAVVYLAANKLLSAQSVAEEAYRTYPSLDTLLLLANTLQLEGKYPSVNQLLGSKRETYANSAKFLITLAENEYNASMWVSAHKDIDRAISLDSSSFQAHYILGNVLVKQGDLDRAITEYQKAIKLKPDEPRTYYHLALVYRTKNDTVDEERPLEHALAADRTYAPAHCEIGRILIGQNKLQDAVSHLKLAVEYNPDSEEAYFLLVRAYAKLGEREQAEAMVKRLVAVRKANRHSDHSRGPEGKHLPGGENAH